MFNQIWKKYLPIISLLLKRAITEDQNLLLNQLDFERAAGGRKIKYSFTNLTINNAKIDYTLKSTPFAIDFGLLLIADENILNSLYGNNFKFTLKSDFKLNITKLNKESEIEELIESENILEEADLHSTLIV